MTTRQWRVGPIHTTACFAALLSTSGFAPLSANADHPSHSVTVRLGPGNEDVERQLTAYKGISELPQILRGFRGSDLSGRDLRRSRLHLHGFELRDINFDNANLAGSNLVETFFDGCTFRSANLRRVYLSGEGYIRANCNLTDADIAGSAILLTKEQLLSTRNYKQKSIMHTVLPGDLSGISFAGFDLRGTVLRGNLEGCDFSGAEIGGCTIRMTKEQLATTKNYREKDLDGIRFVACDFRGADLSGQNLGYFVQCDLEGADFLDASFSKAPPPLLVELPSGSYGFQRSSVTASQFYSTRTYRSSDLRSGFGFVSMDLEGWDFSGMDLQNVSFPQSSLRGARLEDARGGNFRNAEGLTVEQIKSVRNYKLGRLDEPGFALPDYILEELQAEKEAAKE